LEGRDWEDHDLRIVLAKSSGNPISTKKKLGIVALTYQTSYLKSVNRRIMDQDSPGINVRLYSKYI
jgi:hypothetical protein